MKRIIILCLVGLLVANGYCQWGKQLTRNKALLGGAIRTGLKGSRNIKYKLPIVAPIPPIPINPLDSLRIIHSSLFPKPLPLFDAIPSAKFYEHAQFFYQLGDTLRAVQFLRYAAERGYADAQYDYGRLLVMRENGIKQDKRRGWNLIRKAAGQGHSIAMYELGREYYYNNYGTALPHDTIQGLAWMKKAADADTCNFCAQLLAGEFCCNQGDTAHAIKYYAKADEYAQNNLQIIEYYEDWKPNLVNADFLLGYCHYNGKYTSQNVDTAIKYWSHAAHLGEGEAAFYVGIRLLNGTEVSQNICQGIKYIQMAENLGYTTEELPDYQAYIGDCYVDGVGVERDSLKAIEWYKKAGEAGHAGAQYCLTCNYFNANDNDSTIYWGEKTGCRDSSLIQFSVGAAYYNKGDYVNAEDWWKLSAAQKDPDALWWMYVLNENVKKDSITAFEYLKKAVEERIPSAINDMGWHYLNGYIVNKDIKKAKALFLEAANSGETIAYGNLGYIYYWKKYGMKNRKLAAEYWKRGADFGDTDSQYYYGYILKKGHGVKKDKQEAIRWFKLAAMNGSEEAQEELKKMHISLAPEPDPVKIVEKESQPTMQQYRVTGVDGIGITLVEE